MLIRPLFGLAGATCLLVTTPDLHAQPPVPAPTPGASAFAKGMRDIHKSMALGRFEASRTRLLTLLDRHRGQAYVLARKAELLEDFRRCTFHILHPRPTYADALTGRLVAYRPRTDQVTLEYTPKTLGDFDPREPLGGTPRTIAWHGLVFKGPYSVEISGRHYEETRYPLTGTGELRTGLNVHVEQSERGHLEIALGNARGESRRGLVAADPFRVARWTADARKSLYHAASPAQVGRRFRARIDVGAKAIRVYFDGKQVYHRKRTAATFGRFGLEGHNFDKVVVQGEVHSNWLSARVDEKVQERWFDFDREYDASEVPTWLVAGGIPSRRSFNPSRAWPTDVAERHHPVLREMEWLLKEGSYLDGIEYVHELPPAALPTLTRSYLLARFYYEVDEIEKAFRHCVKLCKAAPGFLEGRKLHAELRVRRGQGDAAAIADYRAMLAEHPKARELYVDLAVLLIQARRTAEAETLLRTAVLQTGNAQELMNLQRMLDMVVRGPAWERTFESRSPHFIVKSNIDAAICKQATSLLEAARRRFAKELGMVPQSKAPARVFLFAGQTGYKRFCEDILGERDTHTDGLYSGALKQLLIWNLPDHEQMLRTIRHEGFHQFLDSLVHDSPAWFDEGYAEYFEAADHLRRDHLERLEQGLVPLSRFVKTPVQAFYRGGRRNYAQAWALIHFFRHGDAAYRPIPARMFRALRSGRSAKAAVRAAFAGFDMAALEVALAAHLTALRER